jgi:threonine synthase
MWPWEDVGQTAADGIVDDETYDWLPVVTAMAASGGEPVVSAESEVLRAWQLVRDVCGINSSATGSAGLAGLLTLRAAGAVADTERVAVVVSGVQRA